MSRQERWYHSGPFSFSKALSRLARLSKAFWPSFFSRLARLARLDWPSFFSRLARLARLDAHLGQPSCTMMSVKITIFNRVWLDTKAFFSSFVSRLIRYESFLFLFRIKMMRYESFLFLFHIEAGFGPGFTFCFDRTRISSFASSLAYKALAIEALTRCSH